MRNDPIVEEIHAVRRQLLAECGGDLDRYLDRLEELQAEHPERLVTTVDRPSALPEASDGKSGNPTFRRST